MSNRITQADFYFQRYTMVAKGIIKSIDFNGNTCTVRVPVLENAINNSEVIMQATISTVPGIYNGYKEGDVVIVAFENNEFDKPVILGKLYLGVSKESGEARGAINCGTISSASAISIPIDTKLTLDNGGSDNKTVGVNNDLSCYKSIADLARGLQKQENDIGSINVKLIDDGESLGARVTKLEGDDTRHEAELVLHGDEIEARVTKKYNNGTQQGLGWDLNNESWTINAYDTIPGQEEAFKELNILTINRSGMTLNGDLKINGYPSEIVIKYAKVDSPTEYPDFYISIGTKSDIDDYVGHYVEKEPDYVLVTDDNKEQLDIVPGTTEAYDINTTIWEDTEPDRTPGQYIWQWTRTFKYEWIDTGSLETSY